MLNNCWFLGIHELFGVQLHSLINPLFRRIALFRLPGERTGVILSFTMVLAHWIGFRIPASQIHRASTKRQFHFWRGHPLSVGRSWGRTTITRSTLRPLWSVCESMFVNTILTSLGLLENRVGKRPEKFGFSREPRVQWRCLSRSVAL